MSRSTLITFQRIFLFSAFLIVIAYLRPTSAQMIATPAVHEIVLVGSTQQIQQIKNKYSDLSCLVKVPTTHLHNLKEQRPELQDLLNNDAQTEVIVCEIFELNLNQSLKSYITGIQRSITTIDADDEIARLTWSPEWLTLLGDSETIELIAERYSMEMPFEPESVPPLPAIEKLAEGASLHYTVVKVPLSTDIETIANKINGNPSLPLFAERTFMTTATGFNRSFGCNPPPVDSPMPTVSISVFAECKKAMDNVDVYVLDTSYQDRTGTFDYIGDPDNSYQVRASLLHQAINHKWIQTQPAIDNSMHGDIIIETIHTGAPLANIISLPVLDQDGIGTSAALARGLLEVWQESLANKEEQSSVVNMSLAVKAESAKDLPILAAILNAMSEQGIILLGAAGNDGKSEPYFPARFSSVGSVGAANWNEQIACYSNRGADFLAAVGDDSAYPDCNTKKWVQECALFPDRCFNMTSPSSYTGRSATIGSSLATPLVTARAACLVAQGMSPVDVLDTLHQ